MAYHIEGYVRHFVSIFDLLMASNEEIVCNVFINTLRPMQMADIFQTTFSNVFSWMKIAISLTSVPGGQINNIPAMVQKTAWRQAIVWTTPS